jgi:hypothetical protein
MQCWNGSVDDMCKRCFDETLSDCPENDGLNHLQWLIFMGLHFVIGKCTQPPTNLITVRVDEYHLLIFQHTPTPCLSRTFIPRFKMSEFFFLANTRLRRSAASHQENGKTSPFVSMGGKLICTDAKVGPSNCINDLLGMALTRLVFID